MPGKLVVNVRLCDIVCDQELCEFKVLQRIQLRHMVWQSRKLYQLPLEMCRSNKICADGADKVICDGGQVDDQGST